MSLQPPLTKCPKDISSTSQNGSSSKHDHENSSTSAHSPDSSSLRDRAVKEVGMTSSAFIGPAFPPPNKTAQPLISDMEDEMSEFYKELENMDSVQEVVNKAITDIDVVDGIKMKSEDFDYRNRVHHRQASRPHWYHNEPYSTDRRRPRAAVDSESTTRGLQYPPYPPTSGPHQTHIHHCTHSPPNISTHDVNSLKDPQYSQSHHWGQDLDHRDPHWNMSQEPPQPGSQWNRRSEYNDERWEQQYHSRPPDQRTLILMRGLPGSGKSTLARELSGPSGVILSTDDYFAQRNGYDRNLIGKAHEWNQRRAKDAMYDGCSPIIIDNTNTEAWEMKPYVKMALDTGYRVDFCEPDTRWKFDPSELEKRNKHGVSHDKICHMLRRFSFPISIDIVLSAEEPPHVRGRTLPGPPH